MDFDFKIIDSTDIEKVIPLVFQLNNSKISEDLLKERFLEMVKQNYECACIFHGETVVGVTGIWYCTRHYAGKSVEVDHVYIEESYRAKGLGKQFFKWIDNYVKSKGCEAIELNTYVQNYPSHKFYYNEGFQILGYHFLKKM